MTGERVDVALEAMDVAIRDEFIDTMECNLYCRCGAPNDAVQKMASEILALRARVQAAEGEKDEEASVYGKYGNCPVQIERTVGDRQFYFRARGEHWSLCVGAAGDMSEFAAVDGEEILSGQINVPFIAGWMPAQLAEQLTDWGISAWTRQQSGEFKRNTKELLDALDAARGVG